MGNYDDDDVTETGSHYVYSPECPGTCSVDQAGIKSVHHYAEQFFGFRFKGSHCGMQASLELTMQFCPSHQMLGFKECANALGFKIFLLIF